MVVISEAEENFPLLEKDKKMSKNDKKELETGIDPTVDPLENKKKESEKDKKGETEKDKKEETEKDKKGESEKDKKGETKKDKKGETEKDKKEETENDKNFPPKVDSEVLKICDGVTKQIIKEGGGKGEKKYPTKDSICFVHYRAWVGSPPCKIEDTWEEGQIKEIGPGPVPPPLLGLSLALLSMPAGELSLCHVSSQLAYGREGSFSFPHVSPHADVTYEVSMVGFDRERERRGRGEMTAEERIEAGERRREEGNERYREGKVEEAAMEYQMALSYLGDEFMFQMYGKYRQLANSVRIPSYLNLAACQLRLGRYQEAVHHCDVVLSEEETNVKAFFRRGKARAALGQSEAAKKDFLKANKLEPGDKAVLKELQLIKEIERQSLEKEKKLYKGIFAKANPPPPPSSSSSSSSSSSFSSSGKLSWFVSVWKFVVSVFNFFWPFSSVRPKRD